MHKQLTKQTPRSNEGGFASIVIALTLIIVLALLTVGFAQLARREQQTALDKQLANQAYYAAESGVNDAVKDISTHNICDQAIVGIYCAATNTSTTSCMHPASPSLTSNPNVSGSTGTGVSYTCLLVDLTPPTLTWTNQPPGGNQYLTFSTTQPLDTLTINWQSTDGQNTPWPSVIANKEFQSLSGWNSGLAKHPPVVLFSLTNLGGGGGMTRQQLINNTFNLFLFPAKTMGGATPLPAPNNYSTPVNFNPNNQGQVIPGDCNQDPKALTSCSVTITGLGGGTHFVMYFTNYYDEANIQISGTQTALPGLADNFIGQDEIDVTGKAHNVVKRIHVQLTASPTTGVITTAPLQLGDAQEAKNICKQIHIEPTDPVNKLQSQYIDLSGNPINNGNTINNLNSTDPCNLSN